MMKRWMGVLAGAVAGMAVPATGGAPDSRPKVPGGNDVLVSVSHLRSDKGTVIACLTADPQRFPRCADDRQAKRAQVAAGKARAIVFHDVRPGTYAVALLHDENNNGKADRAMSMIPREGFGFSRDAKVHMGPPRFRDAAFAVPPGGAHMTITMRYML